MIGYSPSKGFTARRGEEGAALLAALLIMIILGAGATATWRYMLMSHDHIHRQQRFQQSRHLAEAGLDAALAALRVNQDFPGEHRVRIGWGQYTTQVTKSRESTTGDQSSYTIISTGQLTGGEDVLAEQTLVGQLRLDSGQRVLAYTWEVQKP